MSHLHLKSGLRSGFRLSTLALSVGMALMSTSGFALEALNDEGLAESTGEGVAILPEDFSMQFNGADNTAGTGYIRLIPVGPLTKASQDTNKDGLVSTSDHSVGKADIYLYGLAISQSNKAYNAGRVTADTSARFGRNIDSWGSAVNPWLIKVSTQADVPDFSAPTSASATKGDVSFLMLEAPLYSTNVAGLSNREKSAYNLKMGLWSDIFVRDPTKVEGDANQFSLGQNFGSASDSTRPNRLRLQAVWDGFSLNGSNVKMFQTLAGVTPTEVTQGLNTSYNNTFGIASVLRFNGGDGQNLRASYTDPNNPTGPMISSGNNALRTAGAYVMSDATAYGCGDGSSAFATSACEYRFRSQTVQDKLNSSSTWKAPSASSVLRISTREIAGTDNSQMLNSPALGGTAPSFDPNEGIFLYNPNINLVLGNIYQPLTFGTDGKNITLEIARIPNKESIYKQVYSAYAGATGALTPTQIAEYKGSTCNIYQCGTSSVSGYQGSNATHSSITIGSTVYDAATNSIKAYDGLSAVGISFGALQDNTVAAGTGTKNYTRWQDQQRQARLRQFDWTDNYTVSCFYQFGNFCSTTVEDYTDPYTGIAQDCSRGAFGSAGCNRSMVNNGNINKPTGDQIPANPANPGPYYVQTSKGYHLDWIYRDTGDADNGTFGDSLGAYTDAQIAAGNDTTNGRDYTNRAAQANNLSWTVAGRNANWADSTSTSALIRGVTLDNIPVGSTINTSPTNNFGSAAIDGLLINHMKFTTKGL